MEKKGKTLTSFADHLDEQYGLKGTELREQFEKEFEAFKLEVMPEEQGLGQEPIPENYFKI